MHWGEEIEYHLYDFDESQKKVRHATDADDQIRKFGELVDLINTFDENEDPLDIHQPCEGLEIFGFGTSCAEFKRPEFLLMPEFTNFMIEAVPNKPYGAYSDPDQLLACHQAMIDR